MVKKVKMVKKKRIKLVPLPKLKKKAWSLMSERVRKSSMDHAGYVTCYTCGAKKPYNIMDCGHFIHNKLDLDERNLKPQCVHCNQWLKGNLGNYAYKLIKDNGLEWVERLQEDARKKGNLYSREELENIIETLKHESN